MHGFTESNKEKLERRNISGGGIGMRPYKRGAFLGLVVIALILLSFAYSFAETLKYTYDDLYRLISVEYGRWNKVQYSYDAIGNRYSKQVIVSSGSFKINNGAYLTNSVSVTLSPTCLVEGGCTEIQMSNDGTTWLE